MKDHVSGQEDTLVQFTITLPFSLSASPQSAILTQVFLLTLREAVYSQTWVKDDRYASENFADGLYTYLVSNSELKDLLSKFPEEVSQEELFTKVEQLTSSYVGGEGLIHQITWFGEAYPIGTDDLEALINQQPWARCFGDTDYTFGPNIPEQCDERTQTLLDVVIPGLREYYDQRMEDETPILKEEILNKVLELITASGVLYDDTWNLGEAWGKKLSKDQSNLYQLAMWNPEAESNAIDQLKTLLDSVPEVVRIRNVEVEVPFKQSFVDFLKIMQDRQAQLRNLQEELSNQKDTPPWLMLLNQTIETWFWTFVGNPIKEDMNLASQFIELGWNAASPYLSDDVELFIEGAASASTLALRQGLVALSGIAQLGADLQNALVQDPLHTLAGMALGIAGAGTGGFLFLDIYYYVTEPSLGWGGWRADMGNPYYQTGLAAGEFAAGIGQIIVSGVQLASPGATPGATSISINISRSCGLELAPGEVAVLQGTASYIITISREVVRKLEALGVGGLGANSFWQSTDFTGDEFWEAWENSEGDHNPKPDNYEDMTPPPPNVPEENLVRNPGWRQGSKTPNKRSLTWHAAEEWEPFEDLWYQGSLTRHGFDDLAQLDNIIDNPTQILVQENGAKVYLVKKRTSYDFCIVDQSGAIVTAMKNKSGEEIRLIAQNYGWKP